MNRRWMLALVAALFIGGVVVERFGSGPSIAADGIPAKLSNQEFWTLATKSSEPDGVFHSENLVSNEARFQSVIPTLTKTATPGRVYLGVGPEQNFSYMAAVRPKMAFIVDLRRGNFDLQLIYKAIFEMSGDRAEFVSRMFSRSRPAGLAAKSSAREIFAAFEAAAPKQALYARNLDAIETALAKTHGFALSAGDRQGIEFVYRSWFESGPDLHYELTGAGGFGRGGGFPTYADLMTSTDDGGQNQSYLATEERFAYIKDLETRNMVVPIVGNFGGKTALRAVALYLKSINATVSAFYVSNVEQYLRQSGIWQEFCANAARLPVDRTSVFIRSVRGGFGGSFRGPGFQLEIDPIAPEVAACASAR